MSHSVPTYFIVISSLAIISLVWGFWRAQRRKIDLRWALDLYVIVLVAAFLGARAFHVIYENLDYYLKSPIEIFYFWQGGFVYYGGLIGAMIAGVSYLKITHQGSWGIYFDLIAPMAALSYSLGRWSCFFAGCCYGKHCDLPWGIDGRHPTQIYAFLWDFVLGLWILYLERRGRPTKGSWIAVPGVKFCFWLGFHSIGRILMEYFRDDDRGPIYYVSISTWISVVLLIGALGVAIDLRKKILH